MAFLKNLTGTGVADDAAGDNTGDLTDGGDGLVGLRVGQDSQDGVVELGGAGVQGVEESAGLLADQKHAAVTGAAIDVHIKDGQKDPDAEGGALKGFEIVQVVDGANSSVGGTDDGGRVGGDVPVRVAKEGQESQGEGDGERGQPCWSGEEGADGQNRPGDQND